jgi:hypothetical protein
MIPATFLVRMEWVKTSCDTFASAASLASFVHRGSLANSCEPWFFSIVALTKQMAGRCMDLSYSTNTSDDTAR